MTLILILLLVQCSTAFVPAAREWRPPPRHATRAVRVQTPPNGISHPLLRASESSQSENDLDDYSPDRTEGCVADKSKHIRILDQSLEKSSGFGIFCRINDMLWEEAGPNANTDQNITTPEELDQNERFGILSHGTQQDPIYNYGNWAALTLFDYSLEELCQTPSRYSTVESLMDDREKLIQQINDVGYGTISDAVRQTTNGSLFVIQKIWIWHVYHPDGRRIGLAALYDRARVEDYAGPPL